MRTNICLWVLVTSALFILVSCDSGAPPLQEGQATLTLSANPTQVKNMGGVSRIRVRGVASDGRPVPDGTRIQLDTTEGFIVEEVILNDGEAFANYQSGVIVGDVVISARSGTLGTDGSVNTTVSVVDGRIQLDTPNLRLSPNNLPEIGGLVNVTLVLTDQTGIPVPGKGVVFSSDRGNLESNGVIRYTDQNGIATDRLELNRLIPPAAEVNVTAQVENIVVSEKVTITSNENPVPVIIVSPAVLVQGQTVHFDGSTSNDPDGVIISYEWNFGDGSFSNDPMVQHVYEDAGNYTVVLTVVDNFGASQSLSQTVTIGGNELPTAAFTFSPAAPRANDEVFFNAQDSTDVDGTIVSYEWDFGDDTVFSSGLTVSHVYLGAGKYTVTLKVTDDEGATGIVKNEVEVTGNILPTAKFTWTPENPKPDEDVGFDATESSDEDGEIVRYTWHFASRQVATGGSPLCRHVFDDSGVVVVFLTVEDNEGGLGFASNSVTVSPNLAPVASFEFSPAAPETLDSVLFDGSASSDPDGTIKKYTWSFGDGSQGSGPIVNHAFQSSGAYNVSLFVTDNEDLVGATSMVVEVATPESPSAKLAIQQDSSGKLLLDAGESNDNQDGLEGLTFEFEAKAPNGVDLVFSGTAGPTREVTITSQMNAFQLFFLLTVRDSEGNASQITRSINYPLPMTSAKQGGDQTGQ